MVFHWCVVTGLLVVVLVARGRSVCPPRCRCDNAALLTDCTGAQFDSFPIALNPRLHQLLLSHNAISRLDGSVMSSYDKLRVLLLAHNNVSSISPGAFTNQPHLRQLRLNNNRLSVLKRGCFRGLLQLRLLDLSHNQLRRLPDDLLSSAVRLEQLILSGNLLSSLQWRSPSPPRSTVYPVTTGTRLHYASSSLASLDLAHNSFVELPLAALVSLPGLTSLNLAFNRLRHLAAGQLASVLPSIVHLNLSSNDLHLEVAGVFSGLSSLRSLALQDVDLHHVHVSLLSPLLRLEVLFLDNNPFSRLTEPLLSSLRALKMLSVRACDNLEHLDDNLFSSNKMLHTLMVEQNSRLTSLPDNLLRHVPRLQRLSLRANSLSTLAPSSSSWNQLRSLDLSLNPWTCDCRLRWLASFLAAEVSVNSSRVVCAKPVALQGRSVRSLGEAELSCGVSGGHVITVAAGAVGAAVLLILAILCAILCHKHRCRLRKMLMAVSWRDRVKGQRPEASVCHHTRTYYYHDIYASLDPRDRRLVPVTEL